MTDAEFLRLLESCELPESDFGHAAHVRAAYLYLRQASFADALAQLSRAIRRYAQHLGNPGRYHETITVAYVALIRQHICERGSESGWAEFARKNPELFERQLLDNYYSRSQLDSGLARQTFLLPRQCRTGV